MVEHCFKCIFVMDESMYCTIKEKEIGKCIRWIEDGPMSCVSQRGKSRRP